MAKIQDSMAAFELLQPATTDDALALLRQYKSDAWVMAGGLDTYDWLKDRNKRPEVVVSIGAIPELTGIKVSSDGGLEIGAATTLIEVIRHPVVKEKFPILAQSAELVASPQIRNQGTIGGNLSQDTRCWYYRSGWKCYRAGGNICYADTPTAINREHAIFDSDRCVAVNPSDTAPALVALDAKIVVRNTKGEWVVDAEDFFIGPGTDIRRMTILEPGDLLTSIRIPGTWAGAAFYFEKVRERQVWDFPIMNVAAAFKLSGNNIERARLVVNAVAARPKRLQSVEAALAGKPRTEETGRMAGEMAVEGAEPLAHNAYKVPLMRNLVKRAIRGGEEA